MRVCLCVCVCVCVGYRDGVEFIFMTCVISSVSGEYFSLVNTLNVWDNGTWGTEQVMQPLLKTDHCSKYVICMCTSDQDAESALKELMHLFPM